jgi:hypothetical protein
MQAFVDNAYARYRQDAAQLKAVLREYASTVSPSAVADPVTVDQLRVVVRPTSYLAYQRATQAKTPTTDPGPPLTRSLAGDLLAYVAVDRPTSYVYLPGSTLRKQLKMDDDAIWARALENTARHVPVVKPQGKKKSLVGLVSGEGLSSSLLAEPVWDTPEMQIGGPPVVAPLEKDMVLLTHLSDARGIAALRKVAAQSRDDPDGLTDQLFVRRNGAWEVLPP